MEPLRRSHPLVLTVAALLAMGVSLSGPKARAWCRITTESSVQNPDTPCVRAGEPLEWRRACISYAVDARGALTMPLDTVRDIVDQAFFTWESVLCNGEQSAPMMRQLEDLSMCIEAEYNRNGDENVNTIAFIEDWDDRGYDPNAFAQTIVWHNPTSGEIYDVDIQVNEQLGPYTVCPADGCPTGRGGAPRDVDLLNVMTHEVGHFLGLAHTPDDPEATMYFFAARGETEKRSLRPDDEAGLCAAYPPSSLPDTCDYTPRGGLELDCESAGGCTCSVQDKSSRPIHWLFGGCVLLLALSLRRRALSRESGHAQPRNHPTS